MSDFRGDIMVEQKISPDLFAHLLGLQRINLGAMIFVIGQTMARSRSFLTQSIPSHTSASAIALCSVHLPIPSPGSAPS
jgi:hypothetical protein